MRRREFITLLGGAATWSLAAGAQQASSLRRVDFLLGVTPDDPYAQPFVRTFEQALQEFGWIGGRNIEVRLHWPPAEMERMRGVAKEIVGSGTDVVFATGTAWVASMLQESREVPIVFALVSDPVGKGFVASLGRPGGNLTGFSNLEPSMGGKWLEMLKELAPQTRRCAMIFHPSAAVGQGAAFLDSFQAAASSLGVTPVRMPVVSEDEIKTAIAALGAEPDSGLVVMSDQFLTVYREIVVKAAAVHKVPAIYPFRNFVVEGGLMSYGVSAVDLYRRSASYVDRILRGERTSELPVQRPDKFELVINHKTVQELGLEMTPRLLSLLDEVIE
jgi:putative ABC transport system substrate-binding protein